LILVVLFRFGQRLSKKSTWLMGGIGILGLGAFTYGSSWLMSILDVLRSMGVSIRGDLLHVSSQRLRMWDLAWQSIQEQLWLGTGYGTWLREFSQLPGSGGVSYDTAHNLWVQQLFELGVIHVVVMVIILGLIVWTTLIYKSVEQPSLRIGGLFLTIGFFVASVVQEIDYHNNNMNYTQLKKLLYPKIVGSIITHASRTGKLRKFTQPCSISCSQPELLLD
jgi:O-antigen ligase